MATLHFIFCGRLDLRPRADEPYPDESGAHNELVVAAISQI
jgi:hypothetical protein